MLGRPAGSAGVRPASSVGPNQRRSSCSSWASLLARDGSTLRVDLTAPFCGSGYQRHLLETDAVIVVWATGAPDGSSCGEEVEPRHRIRPTYYDGRRA